MRRWCQLIKKCVRSSEAVNFSLNCQNIWELVYFHYITFVTDLFFFSTAEERTQADGSSTKPSHLHRLEPTGRDLRGIMPIAQHQWFLLFIPEKQKFVLRAHIYQARSLIGSDASGLSGNVNNTGRNFLVYACRNITFYWWLEQAKNKQERITFILAGHQCKAS